jgi:hypothetical protein
MTSTNTRCFRSELNHILFLYLSTTSRLVEDQQRRGFCARNDSVQPENLNSTCLTTISHNIHGHL